jgi:addiction module HigA family antidote
MARNPIHPGEHLAEALEELGISAAELARQIQVPTNRITGILNEKRAISADTALRLGHWFGTSADFWLNLQKLYELRLAEREKGLEIRKLRKPLFRLTWVRANRREHLELWPMQEVFNHLRQLITENGSRITQIQIEGPGGMIWHDEEARRLVRQYAV